jgi:hypothetical protein
MLIIIANLANLSRDGAAAIAVVMMTAMSALL